MYPLGVTIPDGFVKPNPWRRRRTGSVRCASCLISSSDLMMKFGDDRTILYALLGYRYTTGVVNSGNSELIFCPRRPLNPGR